MTMERYVNFHYTPDDPTVLVISNDGDAIDTIISMMQASGRFASIEVSEAQISDYIAPSNVSESNTEPEHELYRYEAVFKPGQDFSGWSETELEAIFEERNLLCDVNFMTA